MCPLLLSLHPVLPPRSSGWSPPSPQECQENRDLLGTPSFCGAGGSGDAWALRGLCVPAPVQTHRDTHGCSMPRCSMERAPPCTQGWAQPLSEPQPSVGGPSRALVMLSPARLSFCFVLINLRLWGWPGPWRVVCGAGRARSWARGRECAGGAARGKSSCCGNTILT